MKLVPLCIDFSEDNGRIILQKLRDGTCKLIIKNVEFKDEGEWSFSTEVIEGNRKLYNKYEHHIVLRQNGKTRLYSIVFLFYYG